jgi:hypothetical protein
MRALLIALMILLIIGGVAVFFYGMGRLGDKLRHR